MTRTPSDPSGVNADASPTEPVPALTPPVVPSAGVPAFVADAGPAFAPAEPAPTEAGTGAAASPAYGFAPVEPGPAGYTVPPARPVSSSPKGGGSRVLAYALGAAILVGVVGLAFAAGRATSPATDAGAVSSEQDLYGSGAGGRDGQGGLGPMQKGGMGGNLPDASFDLDGEGSDNGRGGDADGDHGMPPGGGFGRGGFGAGTITGTVESVDADSLTVKTESGYTVTVGLDGSTTYHQATDAQASDVTVGTTVEIAVAGRVRPQGGSDGELDLGTASDVTIEP